MPLGESMPDRDLGDEVFGLSTPSLVSPFTCYF